MTDREKAIRDLARRTGQGLVDEKDADFQAIMEMDPWGLARRAGASYEPDPDSPTPGRDRLMFVHGVADAIRTEQIATLRVMVGQSQEGDNIRFRGVFVSVLDPKKERLTWYTTDVTQWETGGIAGPVDAATDEEDWW